MVPDQISEAMVLAALEDGPKNINEMLKSLGVNLPITHEVKGRIRELTLALIKAGKVEKGNNATIRLVDPKSTGTEAIGTETNKDN